jgi:hypothetical protein
MTFMQKVMMGAGNAIGQAGRRLALCFGLALATGGGSTAWAATNSWKNAGDGLWEAPGNWSLGVAPSSTDNKVYITNAASKTVTINASTSAGNLTVSNLVIEAPSGATNTLLLSGNTTPLTCLSAAAGTSLILGESAGKAGALVVDGGALVTTNATGDAWATVGLSGPGILTVSNGTWRANQMRVGWFANGVVNLINGTNTILNSTIGQNYTGTVNKIGGLLLTTNGSWTVGSGGVGTMTASGGVWQGYSLAVAGAYGGVGRGTLNLIGGTNLFNTIGIAINSTVTGSVTVSGGLLVVTNAAGGAVIGIGGAGIGDMTVSNGTLLADAIVIGQAVAGGRGELTLMDSMVRAKSIAVGYSSRGTLNLVSGTNIFTVGPQSISQNGAVWMTGGLLVTTNTQFQLGINNGPGAMTVSNGTWMASSIYVGWNRHGNSLTIRGGQVLATDHVWINVFAGTTSTNNVLLITSGGLLEALGLQINGTAGYGNVITNSGGVYQFFQPGPTINTNGGPIYINGGTISYRNVTTVDVKGNWSGTQLTKMTWSGTNAFRLNNSTNLQSTNQTYTFASNLGSTNYARLELVNGSTCYRSNVTVTVGTGGSVLFSNTTALLQGQLVVTNGGGMTVADSSVTITGACAVAENSMINWSSNALGSVVYARTLTLPVNATFTLNGPIGSDETRILFSVTNSIMGSPTAWTVSPVSHQVAIDGTTLVLEPKPPRGTVIGIR